MKNKFLSFFAIVVLAFSAACTPEVGPEPLDPSEHEIEVTPTSFEIGFEGEVVSVSVKANCNWNVTKMDGSGELIDWVKSDAVSGIGNKNFKLKIYKNPTGEARTAQVEIKSEGTAAYIDVTQAANPDPGSDDPVIPEDPDIPTPSNKYKMPVYQMLETAGSMDITSGKIVTVECNFTNATVDGNIVTFDNGLVIEKTGSSANFLMAHPVHTNPKQYAGFQLGLAASFTAGEAWIYKIPMETELSGDLRFTYGSRKEGISSTDPYKWSTDGGATWNPIDKMEAIKSEAAIKSIWFTIPADKKVEAGKELWIKIEQKAALVYIQNGITLDYAKAELSTLPKEDNTSVVISEGFDDTIDANASYIEVPGFIKSATTGTVGSTGTDSNGYAGQNAALSYKHGFARPGFLQLGGHDEAIIGRSGWNGEITMKVGERLQAMGITSADLKISFKGAYITNAYNNQCDAKIIIKDGENTVAEVESLTYDKFSPVELTVKGATQSTVLVMTSAPSTKPGNGTGDCPYVMADYRFFIDDLLVTVSGSSTDPDTPDPEPTTKVLTFDFKTKPGEDWPIDQNAPSPTTCIYPLDGVNYSFILIGSTDATAAKIYWHEANQCLTIATQYRYLGLPVIEGYTLTTVEFYQSAPAATVDRIAAISSNVVSSKEAASTGQGDPTFVSGGERKVVSDVGTYVFNLTGTTAGTQYYLYCAKDPAGSSGYRVQTLTLTYTK